MSTMTWIASLIFSAVKMAKTAIYYIIINEIPGELFRKLDIFTCENVTVAMTT